MQIPVARVKNIPDLEAVFLSDLVDAPQRGGQFRPRNHAVLHVICRRDPADRPKRVLAALPKQIALVRVPRHAHLPRVMQPANVGHFLRLRFSRFAQPIHVDQQHGRRVQSDNRREHTPRPRAASIHRAFRKPQE